MEKLSKNTSKITYINGILVVNKEISLPSTYEPGNDEQAIRAFNNMRNEALKSGVDFKIESGFRSYKRQEEIYNEYVKEVGEETANTFSAKPGHSEHQSGLAFDVGIIDDSFEGTKECIWLRDNAHRFGFIVRYPKGKENITGYKYEPWHIRYIGVIHANNIYYSGKCLEEYLGLYKN